MHNHTQYYLKGNSFFFHINNSFYALIITLKLNFGLKEFFLNVVKTYMSKYYIYCKYWYFFQILHK